MAPTPPLKRYLATYGTLKAFAHHLGNEKVTRLLNGTLKDEKATDVALTKIAESYVSEEAVKK